MSLATDQRSLLSSRPSPCALLFAIVNSYPDNLEQMETSVFVLDSVPFENSGRNKTFHHVLPTTHINRSKAIRITTCCCFRRSAARLLPRRSVWFKRIVSDTASFRLSFMSVHSNDPEIRSNNAQIRGTVKVGGQVAFLIRRPHTGPFLCRY